MGHWVGAKLFDSSSNQKSKHRKEQVGGIVIQMSKRVDTKPMHSTNIQQGGRGKVRQTVPSPL